MSCLNNANSPETFSILCSFLLAIIGWIFRKGFVFGQAVIPNWSSLLGLDEYVHDSTVALFCAFLMFMLPAGTGPKTVIFASERITVAEMAKCGLWLKLISLILLTLILYFIVMPLLNLETSLRI